jgi:rhodanese-related sulfurtransferase
MKKLLTLLAIAFVSASSYAGEFPDISITEVKSLAESKKAVIIDVNGTESYQKGHIPGALNYETVRARLAKVLPSDKNALIVAYCGGPKCKAYQAAATAAEKLGYKNIKHMSAGIAGWKEAGQKMEKSEKGG